MAEDSLERELQCAICTDILYQPLTLLDCLHTFCGSCLKEWFEWQAASSIASGLHQTSSTPYTCPSCRESVRGTRLDHRVNTLLEMFLKASPGRGKTEAEKEEMRAIYSPGDDVLKPVTVVQRGDGYGDSEDERLMAQVREMSLAGMGASGSRRGENRSADRRRRDGPGGHSQRSVPTHLTESRLRQHDRTEPQMEHQPSLRSLLSASDAQDQDVQAEILRSIYAEGVLDGLDLDNLTTEQEEELTDRIAQAYVRRQQQQPRQRSSSRDRRARESRSPRSSTMAEVGQNRDVAGEGSAAQQAPRSRQPITGPNPFDRGLQEPARDQRRSTSSTGHRSNRSSPRSTGASPAARSATDLSQQPSSDDGQRTRHNRMQSGSRSVTDPETGDRREEIHRMRTESNRERARDDEAATATALSPQQPESQTTISTVENMSTAVSGSSRHEPSVQHQVRPAVSLAAFAPEHISSAQQGIRPVMSVAAFAPEPLSSLGASPAVPPITCERCRRPNIQTELHYNCSRCHAGAFNICRRCYRNEQGCDHWFGFGERAKERWYRNVPQEGWPQGQEFPHVLTPRRYIAQDGNTYVQEGAFCEICSAYTHDCYWYCTDYCLEGAWGYCDACVKQGRHCTHPLLLTSPISYLQQPHHDPTKSFMVDLPHLPSGNYATVPPETHCDICHNPIPARFSRYHCYQCSEGDYDMCGECYRVLVAQGKISQGNGPDGWRRCLQGHRMAIVEYHERHSGGHARVVKSEMVGGWDFKDDEAARSGQIPLSTGRFPPPGGEGRRCVGRYSRFPDESTADELSFPKNAEIREVKEGNEDWFIGVYAGMVNLVPKNHVQML